MIEPVKLIDDLNKVRESIIGRNLLFETPYGKRPLVYADYTASGRGIDFIEEYITEVLKYYANTHTDDDFTGETMTTLLHDAETVIKKFVNAGETGKIIFSGTGATGAITKLQQILGVYWPPATKSRIDNVLTGFQKGPKSCSAECIDEVLSLLNKERPVVFVGPYEHHSNEIMWRQNYCHVVEIPLNSDGEIDLFVLESSVSDQRFEGRVKIGSFSAASNVSGIKTPVYEVAKILHKHDAIACFDFAACAPYIEINMNRDEDSYFDAIFLSPHKFLGGPGSAGLLVFNEKIYQKKLPPTIAAGGTVSYVTMTAERYVDDIEEREKPGTPGILQAIRTALVFQLKDNIGIDNIETIEKFYFQKFMDRFQDNKKVTIYGVTDPEKKINIVAFNVKHRDRIIHPKLFTRLLNDLFGIQTRAGCSCAGPYGHVLLNINKEHSDRYLSLIDGHNYSGLKPGWVRLNFHYSLAIEEFEYICNALEFLINNAEKFIQEYVFNFKSGEWKHKTFKREMPITLDLKNIIKNENVGKKKTGNDFEGYLKSAKKVVQNYNKNEVSFSSFGKELEEALFFHVVDYLN